MQRSTVIRAIGSIALLALMSACDSNNPTSPSTGDSTPPLIPHRLAPPAPRKRLLSVSGKTALMVDPAQFTALANTQPQTVWFYFRSTTNGVWYIASLFGEVYALDGVGSNYYQAIGWQPINLTSYQGYASAGANFSSVSVSADGRTVTIGAATNGGLPDRALALQNTTQSVAWLYFQDARGWWYISDAGSASQVFLLADTDPSILGGMGWQPVYRASFQGYPSAGQTFTSVTLGAGRRTTVFGANSVARLVPVPGSVTLHPGDSTRVQVLAQDAAGNATTLPPLTWQSLTTGITVSSTGLIQAASSISSDIPNGVVQASGGGVTTQLTVAVLVPPSTDTGYVQIKWVGAIPSPAVAAAFEAARRRINGIFKSFTGILPLNPDMPADVCIAGAPALNEVVKGIVIFAQVAPIDGLGNILGDAGPCWVRLPNYLPVAGDMTFDSADMDAMVADGTINGVVLHEMMHTIGFGTIWGPAPQQGEVASPLGADPRFIGIHAQAAYAALGALDAAIGVPVENLGGPGTQGSHWRESVFHSELMTGWADGSMPMSRVTIGALMDLGYDVDLSKADPFTLSSSLRAPSLRVVRQILERIHSPTAMITPEGRVVPITGRNDHF